MHIDRYPFLFHMFQGAFALHNHIIKLCLHLFFFKGLFVEEAQAITITFVSTVNTRIKSIILSYFKR